MRQSPKRSPLRSRFAEGLAQAAGKALAQAWAMVWDWIKLICFCALATVLAVGFFVGALWLIGFLQDLQETTQ